MMVYGTEPERALTIIDSALIVGNIDAYTADFLRAKVYAHSVADPRLDDAIALCESLLQHDSTSAVSSSTAANRRNVLQLMMDAYRGKNEEEQWLKYAIERAELNREWNQETEALRMEAEIGLVLTHLGRRDEGLAKLDCVIAALDKGAPSVDRMDASIIAHKRKITVLENDGQYDAVIAEANAIIQILEDYGRRPSEYAEDSFRLPPIGKDRDRYCIYYKSQAWSILARAYAQTNPANISEARKYLMLFEQSENGRNLSGRRMISPAWKALGEWDKLLALYTELESRMGADTLNDDYASILKGRADAASAQGNHELALSYLNRFGAIKTELDRQLHESEAHEYAAKYHAKEQDRKLQDAEKESAIKDIVIIAIVVLMLIAAVFTFYFARQRHLIKEKNRALVRMIDEQSKNQDPSKSDAPAPNPELFQLIDGIIRGERLFANPSLQRQDIIDRFDISRRSLNDLLAAYADGQSFTAYINSMRLQEAINLLKEEPGLSLTDIAENVGFTPATFRDQFKRQFGMTPTEYRQNLE